MGARRGAVGRGGQHADRRAVEDRHVRRHDDRRRPRGPARPLAAAAGRAGEAPRPPVPDSHASRIRGAHAGVVRTARLPEIRSASTAARRRLARRLASAEGRAEHPAPRPLESARERPPVRKARSVATRTLEIPRGSVGPRVAGMELGGVKSRISPRPRVQATSCEQNHIASPPTLPCEGFEGLTEMGRDMAGKPQ